MGAARLSDRLTPWPTGGGRGGAVARLDLWQLLNGF